MKPIVPENDEGSVQIQEATDLFWGWILQDGSGRPASMHPLGELGSQSRGLVPDETHQEVLLHDGFTFAFIASTAISVTATTHLLKSRRSVASEATI